MTDIDAYFDGEMQPEERAAFIEGLKDDLKGCEEVARTQRMLAHLKDTGPMPDLTASILNEVDSRRGFLTRRFRRWVRTGRVGVAASFLFLMLGVAILHRVWPESSSIGTPATASDFFAAGEADAARGVSRFSETLEQIRSEVRPIQAVAQVVTAPRPQDVGGPLSFEAPADIRDPRHRETTSAIASASTVRTIHLVSGPRDSRTYVSVPLDRMPSPRVRVLGVALSCSMEFPVEHEVSVGGNVLHLRSGR